MTRFSPQVRHSTTPGGLGGLAAALQEGVKGFQGQRDREEGQRNRQFAQDAQRGGLLERGITVDSPEAPEGFGSAFSRALAGQPAPPPREAVVRGAFLPKQGRFEETDPLTGKPKMEVQRSGNVSYDPNVGITRAAGLKMATGRADIRLDTEAGDENQRLYGGAVQKLGGTLEAARDLPTARTFMQKEDTSMRPGMSGYIEYQADLAAARKEASGGVVDPTLVMRVRSDYRMQPAVKNSRTIQTAYNRIRNTQDNAVGDLSLIFAYMKMLDPESVVRETEFANAQNAAGVPDQVQNLWNRVLRGERLNPNQRAQFRSQAEQLARGAEDGLRVTNAEYRRLALQFGFDPNLVFSEDEGGQSLRGGAQDSPPAGPVDITQFAKPRTP